MTPDQLARTYLDALGRADLDAMLSLFAAAGRIGTLRIIYDTTAARPLLEQQTGQASWRPGGPPSQ